MYPVSAWFSYKVQHVRLSICESVSVCVCLCVCYMFVCVFLWVCVSVSFCLCVSLCICALRTIECRQRIAGGRGNRHGYHSPSSFFNESGSIWQAQDWRKQSPLHLWMAKLAKAVGEQMVAISEEWN